MALQLFNSLTRTKEVFESREPGVVRMYNCGPTVYGRAHVGNLRSFLFADVLRRWLEAGHGYEVRQVMNITDVGHLQGDAEEGEDKLEAQARKERKDPWEISRHYTELFLADVRALGCREPLARPKASEHVPEMLEIIEGLLAKGYAYRVDGDVYFEVGKFPRYGRLSGNTVEALEAGARIEVREEKRHPADFALWKSDPRHLMKWESRFGPDGFPGWHIECSAMARKHLGDELDIHTGGEDNVFPHHECEIAQSEAFTGKPFARTWLHAKFLQVDGGKMSKSLGNVYTLADVEERGIAPLALRYALIRGHYRQPLNFTWQIVKEAQSALGKLHDLLERVRAAAEGSAAVAEGSAGEQLVRAAREKFAAGMDDDLNVPVALASLFELRASVLEHGLGADAARQATEFLGWALRDVLGLEPPAATGGADELTDERVQEAVRARETARRERRWADSDRLRDELLAQGVVIEDTPAGPVWRRAQRQA